MLLVLFDIFLGLNHAEHACVFALITLTAVKFCIGSGNVNQQHTAVFVCPWRLMCNTLTRRGLCVGCFRVGHCEKATELQAVETLLISDELFRYVHGCVCVWVGACTCVHACMCV